MRRLEDALKSTSRETIRRLEQEFGVKGTAAVFREALARAKAASSKARADLALAEQERGRG